MVCVGATRSIGIFAKRLAVEQDSAHLRSSGTQSALLLDFTNRLLSRRSSSKLRIALALALVLLSPGARAEVAAPSCSNPAAIGVSRIVEVDATRGPRFGGQFAESSFLNDGEVVLTFDDGPLRAHTSAILSTLAAHCTKATFFMAGRMAVADPAVTQEVARQGHTVGTHTWSHRNLKRLHPAHAQAEIELGVSAVRRAVGAPIAPFFRFPYLSHSQKALAHLEERNIAVFSIDIDSFDYRTRDAANVRRKVLDKLAAKRKGIILLHDIHASTAAALPGLLDELKNRGFRVVHLVPKDAAQTVASYDGLATGADASTRRSLLGPLMKAAHSADAPSAHAAITKAVIRPRAPGRLGASGRASQTRAPEPNSDAADWKSRVFAN